MRYRPRGTQGPHRPGPGTMLSDSVPYRRAGTFGRPYHMRSRLPANRGFMPDPILTALSWFFLDVWIRPPTLNDTPSRLRSGSVTIYEQRIRRIPCSVAVKKRIRPKF